MARIIPNANTWIGLLSADPSSATYAADLAVVTVALANKANPTVADLTASHNITHSIQGIDPNVTGNILPTPALDKLFEESMMGTSSGSITGEMYRDDVDDYAWTHLKKGTVGLIYISRFGTAGLQPVAGQTVEAWPFQVSARTAQGLANNTVQTFQLNAAVPSEPMIDVTVVATALTVPSAPLNLVAAKEATGVLVLDWDAPGYNGGSAITGYEIWGINATGSGALTSAGPFTTKLTSGFTQPTGSTTARITAPAAGVFNWYEVKAVNAQGSSAFSTPAGANSA
jgi:hypothetical protein